MPNLDENLAFAPATELRALIADKQITSTELTELYLSRIEALDDQLHSFITLTPEIALEQAAKADAATAKGESLGPLHGLPISIKDLQMTKGVRTTGGSLAYKDRVPDANAAYIDKIFDAGAVMLGKTNTPEFGHLGTSDNRLGPPCGNPWNPERTSGGSSGGAGSSLAAGLCALATGGDGGGSIRIPASFNGIYGIKPTQGRVSSYAGTDGPPAPNFFSQQGPMSRTVADSALLLEVMAGYDPRDPSTMRDPVPDFTSAVGCDIEGLKFGWSLGWGYAAVDPDVAVAAEAGAKVFEELGCTVDESDITLNAPFDTWYVLSTSSAIAVNGHLPEDQLTWYVNYGLEHGRKLSVIDYGRALGERDRDDPAILGPVR